jgi:hypothetical protein
MMVRTGFKGTAPDGRAIEGVFDGDVALLSSGETLARAAVTIIDSWAQFDGVVTEVGFVADSYFPPAEI